MLFIAKAGCKFLNPLFDRVKNCVELYRLNDWFLPFPYSTVSISGIYRSSYQLYFWLADGALLGSICLEDVKPQHAQPATCDQEHCSWEAIRKREQVCHVLPDDHCPAKLPTSQYASLKTLIALATFCCTQITQWDAWPTWPAVAWQWYESLYCSPVLERVSAALTSLSLTHSRARGVNKYEIFLLGLQVLTLSLSSSWRRNLWEQVHGHGSRSSSIWTRKLIRSLWSVNLWFLNFMFLGILQVKSWINTSLMMILRGIFLL